MSLVSALERFFTESVSLGRGDGIVVAFSGGPDSTALLWGLGRLQRARGFHLAAAHLDHGLDPESASRAQAARRLCDRLGVPIKVLERTVSDRSIRRRGREAAARRVRYRALESHRLESGSRFLATAHHRDDQIETVLLRLLQGSGWRGLAGISARNGAILRPLLDVPRVELRKAVAEAGLEPVSDPSNRDLRLRRNHVRHRLLPFLNGVEPHLDRSCIGVARAAAGARLRMDSRMGAVLDLRTEPDAASFSLSATLRLPRSLLPTAAALLHSAAGADYPPPLTAIGELGRQLRAGGLVSVDCGSDWRWQTVEDRLDLVRRRAPVGQFTYTLEVPGVVDLAEVSLRLRIDRAPIAPWMFEGSTTRTGLGPALRAGDSVVVRNRRPGDRVRPLGCTYTRRLKELLIDRRIPREARDRIPLLCVGGTIAWVPGVTIDEAFRIGTESQAWVAELQPV